MNSITLEGYLRSAVKAERRAMLVFSLLTVVLTPFVLLGVIALLLMGLALFFSYFSYRGEMFESQVWLASGCNVVLAYILAAVLGAPRAGRNLKPSAGRWLAAALVLFGAILAMTYLTSWPKDRAGLFWAIYGVAGPAMLALLGMAFLPRDPDYLGWHESIGKGMDGESAMDGAIADGARFAAFLPGLILDCYGQIFGSAWLWHRLDDSEVRLMSATLESLGRGAEAEARDRLGLAPKSSSVDVIRWLAKLELIRAGGAPLRLTDRGLEIWAAHRN